MDKEIQIISQTLHKVSVNNQVKIDHKKALIQIFKIDSPKKQRVFKF